MVLTQFRALNFFSDVVVVTAVATIYCCVIIGGGGVMTLPGEYVILIIMNRMDEERSVPRQTESKHNFIVRLIFKGLLWR